MKLRPGWSSRRGVFQDGLHELGLHLRLVEAADEEDDGLVEAGRRFGARVRRQPVDHAVARKELAQAEHARQPLSVREV